MNMDRQEDSNTEVRKNELRDEELEQAVGCGITRKIDASSPKLFETCCSGTPFQAPSL
jgi:type VI protein secretion system component Hcp